MFTPVAGDVRGTARIHALGSPWRKSGCIRRAIHPRSTPTRLPRWGPRWLRCSSLKYSRYSRSSRLAIGAPRPSRCDARLSPRAVRHRTTAFVWVVSGGSRPPARDRPSRRRRRARAPMRVRALADAFLEGFFDRNPVAVTIGQFHDRVLEDGAVPVSFLHEKIRSWEHTK